MNVDEWLEVMGRALFLVVGCHLSYYMALDCMGGE